VVKHIVRCLAALCVGVPVALAAQGYVPNRVFDSSDGRFSDFEIMAADLARADVVFVGEQHDDPNTHRLELALLEALARRGRSVIVSLEMFERDAQEPLEHFLMGHLEEPEFLKVARPWPRYATDYKPLVDLAVANEWPVVAANVPRPIASEIAKGGLEVLASKAEADKQLFAAEIRCPIGGDPYFKRFNEAMGNHTGAGPNYYYSQCVKDETMAESIARAHSTSRIGDRRPAVVHFNGAFHSDYRQGTAQRTARRLPSARIVVVSVLPVADLDRINPTKDDRKRADYLVYTVRKK
jgi:uncharacterized iron-regulated protein